MVYTQPLSMPSNQDGFVQFSVRLSRAEHEVLRKRVEEVNEAAKETTGFPGKHTVASLSRLVLVDWAVGPLGPVDPERPATKQVTSAAGIQKTLAALRGAKG